MVKTLYTTFYKTLSAIDFTLTNTFYIPKQVGFPGSSPILGEYFYMILSVFLSDWEAGSFQGVGGGNACNTKWTQSNLWFCKKIVESKRPKNNEKGVNWIENHGALIENASKLSDNRFV